MPSGSGTGVDIYLIYGQRHIDPETEAKILMKRQ
jgi:hypothetical protein